MFFFEPGKLYLQQVIHGTNWYAIKATSSFSGTIMLAYWSRWDGMRCEFPLDDIYEYRELEEEEFTILKMSRGVA